jgi:hypothetical protein
MLNQYSAETIARSTRQAREAEAARWALADQVPARPSTTGHGVLTALMGLLSSLVMFTRAG